MYEVGLTNCVSSYGISLGFMCSIDILEVQLCLKKVVINNYKLSSAFRIIRRHSIIFPATRAVTLTKLYTHKPTQHFPKANDCYFVPPLTIIANQFLPFHHAIRRCRTAEPPQSPLQFAPQPTSRTFVSITPTAKETAQACSWRRTSRRSPFASPLNSQNQVPNAPWG